CCLQCVWSSRPFRPTDQNLLQLRHAREARVRQSSALLLPGRGEDCRNTYSHRLTRSGENQHQSCGENQFVNAPVSAPSYSPHPWLLKEDRKLTLFISHLHLP